MVMAGVGDANAAGITEYYADRFTFKHGKGALKMKPIGSAEIYGTWATLLLPINTDESIDFIKLKDDLDFVVSSGVKGIYSNGTASEFYTQTEEEFDRISTLLAETCERAQRPFQIGASHTSAQTMLSRVRRAVLLKPSAIQVILPDWVRVTIQESISFLNRLAEAADPIKFVLYNPPNAKRVLDPTDYRKIAEAVPALAGIKVLDGDANWYKAMNENVPGLAVFVPGHHLATGVGLGAAGSYSNVACLHPVAACRWFDMMKTDREAALRIEASFCKFITDHLSDDRPAPAKDKVLAALGGWSAAGTRIRWPYRWYDEFEVERLKPIARTMLAEFFDLAK
jgi:4-hydroxy-tetrahydrodipicolinate synthase